VAQIVQFLFFQYPHVNINDFDAKKAQRSGLESIKIYGQNKSYYKSKPDGASINFTLTFLGQKFFK